MTWRAPTRRTFVAMLGTAAAALTLRSAVRPADSRDDSEGSNKTDDENASSDLVTATKKVWIGHF